MKIKSTAGIKVSVETFYQANQSHPFASHYFLHTESPLIMQAITQFNSKDGTGIFSIQME